MANIIPVFDLAFMGSGSLNSEIWIDLSASNPNPNSPIPSGSQLWLGYATFISNDKSLVFELRPNLPTKSAGNITDTQLRGFASIATGESKDVDLFYYGNILTLAPVTAVSTGVEKLWLHVRSGNNSVGTFDYIVYYSLY